MEQAYYRHGPPCSNKLYFLTNRNDAPTWHSLHNVAHGAGPHVHVVTERSIVQCMIFQSPRDKFDRDTILLAPRGVRFYGLQIACPGLT